MKKILFLAGICSLFTMVSAQDSMVVSGSFKIAPGATVGILGHFINNGTFTDSGTSVAFIGTSVQHIAGSATITFNNWIVNNNAGITMDRNVTDRSTLTLTNGALRLNGNILTISNSANAAVARTNGYIVSESINNSSIMKWNIGTDTNDHTFPFGTSAGLYIPFVSKTTAGSVGNVSVSTYPTAANNLPFPVSPVVVTHVSDSLGIDISPLVADRFWYVDKDITGGTSNLTFTATPAEVGSITILKAQQWNSATSRWVYPLANQTYTATSATVPGVSSPSVWALSENGTMLTIDGLTFGAKAKGKQVNTFWNTEFEINSQYFTVEKSVDGKKYQFVARVNGAGNSNLPAQYTVVDHDPIPGVSYYRLKQTHFDGSVSYTNPVPVYFGGENRLTIYPNPIKDGIVQVAIDGYQGETITLEMVDLNGKTLCSSLTMPIASGQNHLRYELPSGMAPGVYMLRILGLNTPQCERIIIE